MSQDTIFINVNSEDIKNGRPSIANQCAVSLAASRKFNIWDVGTTYDMVRIGKVRYEPVNLVRFKEFLSDFDSGKKVKPTRFYLKISEMQ